MKYKQNLGSWGESVAAEYLTGIGYVILERNVRTPHGEIDLIAMDETILVFVEVKTRTSQEYGYPEDAISIRKKEHMLASAQAYMQSHHELNQDWRVDVIAIEKIADQNSPAITHFENIITDQG